MSSDPLASAIAALLETHPRARIVLAFSGGLDSSVLAHALAGVRHRLGSLRLVHVDHGLQAASRDWSRHCGRQARRWRLPFTALRIEVRKSRGLSLEAAAREARYERLSRELRAGELLVTAHHLDDQVETLLLQLFRGAGVAGLSAMPRDAAFGTTRILRPLLDIRRAQLERYAARHRLRWVEDPSNRDERFDRNFLRQRVMPLLRSRWVGVDGAVARTSRLMAEAAGLLHSLARRDLWGIVDGDAIQVAALRRLAPARRRQALRAFIAEAGVDMPSSAQLKEICETMLVTRADAQPEVRWAGGIVRRRAGRLELQVKSQLPPEPGAKTDSQSWLWPDNREFCPRGGGRLQLLDDAAGPIDLDLLPRTLHLRARGGGERLRPGAGARTQSLKKLMQAARMTLEERARLPLLFDGAGSDARLIAAGDRWIDASITANVKSRRRARLIWRARPNTRRKSRA